MRKTILWTVLILLTVAVTGSAWADSDVQSEVVDGVTWYYRTTQEWNAQTQQNETYAYIVAGADKYTGNLTVPTTLGETPVRKLHHSCFSQCIALRSVVIPDGVTWIDYASFSGCSALKSVTIPNSVKTISEQAFSSCSVLADLTIPDGVTSIGVSAFGGCISLTQFDIPASVTSLGNDFIRGCSSLKILTVADGNQNYRCVNNCIVSATGSSLIAVPFGCEEVVIPEGVNTIPQSMFDGCGALKSVTLPSSVLSIGIRAFFGCPLTSVTIPENVVSIGSSAFHDCTSLKTVTMPNSLALTTIGSSAFWNCCSLENMTIPGGVSSLGDYAFSLCHSLNPTFHIICKLEKSSVGSCRKPAPCRGRWRHFSQNRL